MDLGSGLCVFVCACVRRTTKPLKVFLSFVLLLSPHKGDTAIKGTKFSWRGFQPRRSQLCNECQTCMEYLYFVLTAIQLL